MNEADLDRVIPAAAMSFVRVFSSATKHVCRLHHWSLDYVPLVGRSTQASAHRGFVIKALFSHARPTTPVSVATARSSSEGTV